MSIVWALLIGLAAALVLGFAGRTGSRQANFALGALCGLGGAYVGLFAGWGTGLAAPELPSSALAALVGALVLSAIGFVASAGRHAMRFRRSEDRMAVDRRARPTEA